VDSTGKCNNYNLPIGLTVSNGKKRSGVPKVKIPPPSSRANFALRPNDFSLDFNTEKGIFWVFLLRVEVHSNICEQYILVFQGINIKVIKKGEPNRMAVCFVICFF